jgi:hypothetical protein
MSLGIAGGALAGFADRIGTRALTPAGGAVPFHGVRSS